MADTKLVARNKKAFYDYIIEDRFEAGLSLLGSEIKSLRDGRVGLKEAFVDVVDGEMFLVDCHIGLFPFANVNNHDPVRRRKLLLHREEIAKITRRVRDKGYTVIPLSVYIKGSYAKLEIGLARGKRKGDKREGIRRREESVEIARALKERQQH